eukprot:5608799-Amphidinium_carterae.3
MKQENGRLYLATETNCHQKLRCKNGSPRLESTACIEGGEWLHTGTVDVHLATQLVSQTLKCGRISTIRQRVLQASKPWRCLAIFPTLPPAQQVNAVIHMGGRVAKLLPHNLTTCPDISHISDS